MKKFLILLAILFPTVVLAVPTSTISPSIITNQICLLGVCRTTWPIGFTTSTFNGYTGTSWTATGTVGQINASVLNSATTYSFSTTTVSQWVNDSSYLQSGADISLFTNNVGFITSTSTDFQKVISFPLPYASTTHIGFPIPFASTTGIQDLLTFPLPVASTSLTVSAPIFLTTNNLSLGLTAVSTTRAINTSGALLGGGNLSADRDLYFGGIFTKTGNAGLTITSSSPTWTFDFSGVGAITAGSGITISSTTGNVTINSTASGGGGGLASTTPFSAGYIPLATTTNSLTNSVIFQSGVNIGIGTTSPGYLLDVQGGNANFSGTIYNAANNSINYSKAGYFSNYNIVADVIFRANGTSPKFSFQDASSNVLAVITTVGNVGIGTTTPQTALSVIGQGTFSSLGTGLMKSTAGILGNATSGIDYVSAITAGTNVTISSSTGNVTINAAAGKREMGAYKNAGAATFTSFGFPGNPTLNATLTNADDWRGPWGNFNTAATSTGTTASSGMVWSVATTTQLGWEPDLYTRIMVSSTVNQGTNFATSARVWVGLTSNSNVMVSTGTPAAQFIGFRFDGFMDTTRFWRVVTASGTANQTVQVTAIPFATDTPWLFGIATRPYGNAPTTTVDFYVNGTLIASSTANVAASSTPLGIYIKSTNLAVTSTLTQARDIQVGRVDMRHK